MTRMPDMLKPNRPNRSGGKEPRRIRREKRTIEAMVRLYCRAHHGASSGRGDGRGEGALCLVCGGLLEYAHMRLDRCRYQEKKPTCGNCPVHCYKPSMKEKVMRVMRYSGPRMMLSHPYYALMHLLDSFRKAPTEET